MQGTKSTTAEFLHLSKGEQAGTASAPSSMLEVTRHVADHLMIAQQL